MAESLLAYFLSSLLYYVDGLFISEHVLGMLVVLLVDLVNGALVVAIDSSL